MTEHQPLWTWPELCDGLGLTAVSGPDVFGIHFDSRSIGPGDLFLPLPGDPGPRFQVAARSERDGHDYISSAKSNGAIGVVTDRDVKRSVQTVRVSNNIDALWALGAYRRAQLNCPVVAVTGSSGKTTLKSFLQSATAGFCAQGSFNNYIGLPLSLAVTPKDSKIAIYEIGTNHSGEIAPLSELAQPTVAVVLNVLPVHIGNFTDLDALEKEKMSISKGLTETGCLVLPHSLRDTKYLASSVETVTFGFEDKADVKIEHINDDHYEFGYGEERVRVKVPGGGQHRAESVAACGAVLVALQQKLEQLREFESNLPPGRGNSITINDVTIVDDSYNANPISMIAALKELCERTTSGRKIALLGQMNELGIHAKRLHESIAPETLNVDIVYCVGALMRHLYEKIEPSIQKYYFDEVNDELLNHVLKLIKPRDIVLVKGSNSFFWQENFVQKLSNELL